MCGVLLTGRVQAVHGQYQEFSTEVNFIQLRCHFHMASRKMASRKRDVSRSLSDGQNGYTLQGSVLLQAYHTDQPHQPGQEFKFPQHLSFGGGGGGETLHCHF